MFSDVFLYDGHVVFLLYFVSAAPGSRNLVGLLAATHAERGCWVRAPGLRLWTWVHPVTWAPGRVRGPAGRHGRAQAGGGGQGSGHRQREDASRWGGQLSPGLSRDTPGSHPTPGSLPPPAPREESHVPGTPIHQDTQGRLLRSRMLSSGWARRGRRAPWKPLAMAASSQPSRRGGKALMTEEPAQ